MSSYDSGKVKKNWEIAKEGFRTKILGREPTPVPNPSEPRVKVDVTVNE
jgi:hypothetical protein